jgi:hypothetical protein
MFDFAILIGTLVSSVFAMVILGYGVYMVRAPVEGFLRWDRRTGYWLYHAELRVSGDEKRALAAAGCFYKAFGFCLAALAAVFLIFVCVMVLSGGLVK